MAPSLYSITPNVGRICGRCKRQSHQYLSKTKRLPNLQQPYRATSTDIHLHPEMYLSFMPCMSLDTAAHTQLPEWLVVLKQYRTQRNIFYHFCRWIPFYLTIVVRAFRTLSQEPFMRHIVDSQQTDNVAHTGCNALSDDLLFGGHHTKSYAGVEDIYT